MSADPQINDEELAAWANTNPSYPTMQRLRAMARELQEWRARAAGRTWPDEGEYQEWLNELTENMPEHLEDDIAHEAIVTNYVRWLESRVAAVEANSSTELHEEFQSPNHTWDTNIYCTCGASFRSRAEQWKHAANALRT